MKSAYLENCYKSPGISIKWMKWWGEVMQSYHVSNMLNYLERHILLCSCIILRWYHKLIYLPAVEIQIKTKIKVWSQKH